MDLKLHTFDGIGKISHGAPKVGWGMAPSRVFAQLKLDVRESRIMTWMMQSKARMCLLGIIDDSFFPWIKNPQKVTSKGRSSKKKSSSISWKANRKFKQIRWRKFRWRNGVMTPLLVCDAT